MIEINYGYLSSCKWLAWILLIAFAICVVIIVGIGIYSLYLFVTWKPPEPGWWKHIGKDE